jgi:ferritin-like metal-binding protein YciE
LLVAGTESAGQFAALAWFSLHGHPVAIVHQPATAAASAPKRICRSKPHPRNNLRCSRFYCNNSNPLEAVMAKEKELKDLFLDTLKDIYFAEKKILSALPKMAKAAQSPKLKAAFEKHVAETDGQVERLEQVFASIDETPKGKTCDAIMGIIDEGKEVMDEYKGMPALDAGLLAAAQAVEHYEISRYGTLKTWANELGYKDAVKLLDATLKEEKATDSALSQLAEAEVNQHAETAEAA